MFPIPWNKSFRKKDGTLVNMEDLGDSGGSDLPEYDSGDAGKVLGVDEDGKLAWESVSQFTPDYENETLEIGTYGDWKYYIPMSKTYVGSGIQGYEIETDPTSTSSVAKIDLYAIIYGGGEIVYKNLIKTLVHNGDKDYEDDYIKITYLSSDWSVTSKSSLYDTAGNVYQSPLTWGYATTVDYKMLIADPV